jgi:hypothetical protein
VKSLNPDSKMWSVGTDWRGAMFQILQFPRIFSYDTGGLWSYPALILRDRRPLWLHLMLETEKAGDGNRLSLLAPAAMAVTPPNSSRLLEYRDLAAFRTRSPEILGRYPGRDIAGMSIREFAAEETGLLCLYPDAETGFQNSESLPPAFALAYLRLSHPAFILCLREFAGDFVKALHAAKLQGET